MESDEPASTIFKPTKKVMVRTKDDTGHGFGSFVSAVPKQDKYRRGDDHKVI